VLYYSHNGYLFFFFNNLKKRLDLKCPIHVEIAIIRLSFCQKYLKTIRSKFKYQKIKSKMNIMNKGLLKGIIAIIIGLTPVILFASTYSVEIWSDYNWSAVREGHEDFTIPSPNFLLGDRYTLIAGNYYTSFSWFVEGNFTILNKATGQNHTYDIFIDATTNYASWSSDHIELILSPGEYTIFWHTDYAIRYHLYSHGWFMTDLNDPEQANDAQNLITMVAGMYGAVAVIVGIIFISRSRYEYF